MSAAGRSAKGFPLCAIASMLEPHAPEEFIESSWGVRLLHVGGRAGKFARLMPWSRLNEILRRQRLDYPRLRLVQDGKPLPVSSYLRHTTGTRGRTNIPRLKPVEFTRELREGATLVLDAVHELSDEVGELAEGLELFFGARVQANLYAGWHTSRGFDLHWDDHDVFILQVSGRKRWSVYGQTRPFPLFEDVERAERPKHEPVWEGTLEDGDLLYMPRGWWHVAMPLAEPTLHLTVGVHNSTGLDLLRWLASAMRASETFRRDLPRLSSPQERAAHVERMREELFAEFDPALIERFYEDQDARTEPRARVTLPLDATPQTLAPSRDALVRLLAPRPLRLEASNGMVEFDSMKRHWRFAEDALLVLRPLAQRRVCTVAELCEASSARLDERTVRALIGELSRHGLVAVVEG